MSRGKIYIKDLTNTEISTLEEGWRNGNSHAFRNRCQCILLSHASYDVSALSELFSVSAKTIYQWLKNWKKHGIIGLITKPGQGRKPKLSLDNEEHVKIVEKAVKDAAENGTNMKAQIIEKLDIKEPFSDRTLRRFLKKRLMPTKDFVDIAKKQ